MMEQMFRHNGKTVSIIGEKRIAAYQDIFYNLSKLQENEKIPYNGNYLGNNELAENIYSKKYFLKDLDNKCIELQPEDTFKRISAFIASVEPTQPKQKEWAEKFYNELFEGRFLPGGRVLAGAGDLYRLKTLANCFVTKIEDDDIDSIYKAAFECARTYSYGGGIGVDISSLRPKDAIVHNAADCSTGAVSFMELYSLTTGLIGQSGRRGALMLTIDIKHPDIYHFIKVKQVPNWVTNQIVEQSKSSGLFDEPQLRAIKRHVTENSQVRFANISIKISDEFMQAVDEQNQFGADAFLIYKKFNRKLVMNAPQDENNHYSESIPAKETNDYEFVKNCTSFDDLNNYLFQYYGFTCEESDILDQNQRDVFCDRVYELEGSKFDIAIKKAGDFLLYFSSGPTGEIRHLVKARSIWDQFIEGNYQTAEPGLIFWSTMKKYSPSNYVDYPVISTNPCAEVPLEDGGACNLGSLNLSRFIDNSFEQNAAINWDQLAETTRVLVRFLDNVVTWNEDLNALPKQRVATGKTRRLGLGIMGIADMLNQLSIAYDSQKSKSVIEKIMSFITNAAFQASAGLSEEKGASPIFKKRKYLRCPFVKEALSKETQALISKKGLRNIAIMSIAPTGSISNIILAYQSDSKNYIGVSSGIEPIFALYYTRRSESFNKSFIIFHSTVMAYLDKMGYHEDIKGIDDLEDKIPAFFHHTAHNIDPGIRIEIQSICQKYIDHSISSTVNLSEDIKPEIISDIYIKAWKNKLKGITIYRDGSRFPILTTEERRTRYQEAKDKKYIITQPDGSEQICHGNEIIKLPNGVLTTVYHYLKQDIINIDELITAKQFKGAPQ